MKRYIYLKRIFDFTISLVGFIVLSPLFLLLAIVIKIESKGPVFFKQVRIGKGKKHFHILKFRSMRVDTPSEMPTHLLQHPEQYITKSGKFLRRTSLDELPQIINILKGEMSMIGPRPALWNQYDLIEKRDACGANDVLPGLTGWAQINGRDEISIDHKANFDGEYIARMSFLFDMHILLRTIVSVIRREGVKEGVNKSSNELSA